MSEFTAQTQYNLPQTAEYVGNKLQKEISHDTLGLERPHYDIGGHSIVFRNGLENPTFSENQENFTVVTNTPEGLLAAAEQITTDPSRKKYLSELSAKMKAGDCLDPAVADCIDGTLASISIGDDGRPLDYYDTDGFAVTLAALSGDAEAQAMVAAKRDALHSLEADRVARVSETYQKSYRQRAETGEAAEPLPLDQIALIHSTAHMITRDKDGTVMLVPAGQKREDGFPRASLHFTANSRVYAHAQAQDTWGIHDKLIVSNLAGVMEASAKKPENLYGVDTWFTVSPGESIKLPDAIIVESATDGEMLAESEGSITFLAKEVYSDAELASISQLAGETQLTHTGMFSSPAEILKEIALRRAMYKSGIPYELQDTPSTDGHGMANAHLGDRMASTALQLGVRSGKHFETAEYQMEMDLLSARQHAFIEPVIPDNWSQGQWTFSGSVPLAMRRQVVANGYAPSRPNTINQHEQDVMTAAV